MEKDLKEHIRSIEDSLGREDGGTDWLALREYNRTHIGYFQHERKIHLFVTFFFAFMFFASVVALILVRQSAGTMILCGLAAVSAVLLVLLGFYVRHYFILENGVQELYRLDERVTERGSATEQKRRS